MAYFPKNKEALIPKLLKGLNIQADIIKPEETEVLPTCFYNKGFAKSGEDLVKIYDIPSSNDKDPSSWVMWTFALFFAMIVSDAGYGFIYLACGFLLGYLKKNPPPSLRRTIKLIKVLGISCIIWGSMTGSWLGISLSSDNFLKKFTVIEYVAVKKAEYHVKTQDETLKDLEKKYSLPSSSNVSDLIEFETKDGKTPIYDGFFKNILLELSLVVGLLHVSTSLVRYMFRNWANFGWLLFALGGYLYFPSYLHTASLVQFFNIASLETSAALGYQLIIGGISVAMFFALIQNRLKGLGEIANLVQVFADILSYLRLYALALASSIMAETFNHMGMSLGLFFGFIVILAGHAINFVLGTMGGVIHGLRLNFIEWYHYSFEGGGKLFKPLKRFTIKS
jgi:V/A-type H+-transporting ATPase subunit I